MSVFPSLTPMGRARAYARRRRRQKGGILPLAALVPAMVAAGKAAALGAAGGAASYGAKRGLKALANRKKKKRANPTQIRQIKRALLRGNGKSLMGIRIK